nr:hypothetical protein [Paracoccus isoporae]
MFFASVFCAVLTVLSLLSQPAFAQDVDRPPAGLMWNRSGLPATLPLQIRSQGGADHVVTLIDPEIGEQVLAGYVRGGSFFRILVPPGEWRIRIASGQLWRGEAALFGPDTTVLELPEPLQFMAGHSRLNGHVLTIENSDAGQRVTGIAARVICHYAQWQDGLFDEHDDDPSEAERRALYSGAVPQDRIGPDPLDPTDLKFSVRSRICA